MVNERTRATAHTDGPPSGAVHTASVTVNWETRRTPWSRCGAWRPWRHPRI